MNPKTPYMHKQSRLVFGGLLLCTLSSIPMLQAQDTYARDAKQPIDSIYTQHIANYTTAPYFNSPLTDYLPSSKVVPTPAKVLGDVSGAPNMLPYAEDVYKYFRLLAASSPRVKVFTIGHTEEGREMIAVAIADESLLANLKDNDARLAQLADPRTIRMNDEAAATLVAESTPVYYITGTIHSPETGAPTALMELAYRLAVDDAPYIQHIRSHVITLITPVVEVDGRDRMVDIYKWHLAHPGEKWPRLIYWGHYVAHDNNRDSMALTLDLSRNVLTTYLTWHAQVLHDLHESVPFLYDNTVGAGPYNAWIDPMLTTEWTMLGWNNAGQMENFGMPGAFTHGDYDTWSPGYLMFLAAMHNGISRLYETFGNGGADTEERILDPDEYSRTWFRPNPPLPKVLWSQRDNNNYEETALLATLSYFSQNTKLFLHNYYMKSKRSILKPWNAGPAAYVLPASESANDRQARLLHVLERQHVEISQTTAPVTVEIPDTKVAHVTDKGTSNDGLKSKEQPHAGAKTTSRTFPAGSYIIRMDQPYSRVADALLDRQYWAPDDPQTHPYDDTGWTFGDAFNVEVVRVTDPSILKASMKELEKPLQDVGNVQGSGPVYAIDYSGQLSLITLRYALKDIDISVADAPFSDAGRQFSAGTFLLSKISADQLQKALRNLNLRAYSLAAMPQVKTHPIGTPRIALMHTWLRTQTEGWWREALDNLHVPYTYISTQTVAQEGDLRSKYDVIIFAPVGRASAQEIVNGLPKYGNPIPWQTTQLTPNIGKLDSTPDIRPGLGFVGVEHLKQFVQNGGLFITSEDTANFAIQEGFAPGVFVAPKRDLRVVGSILQSVVIPSASPVIYGYTNTVPVYSATGLSFTISNLVTGSAGLPTAEDYHRPTGRGGPTGEDIPEGRPFAQPPALPNVQRWQAVPLNEDQMRNNLFLIPPTDRPQVMLRFADKKDLLISGLLKNGQQLAGRVTVVDAHLGNGNVLLFANDPIYRGETIGTYPLVFNAIMNFNELAAGPAVR